MSRGKKKAAKKAIAHAADLERIEGELRKALDQIGHSKAAEAVTDTVDKVKGKQKKTKQKGHKKLLVLLAVGGALVLSEDLRSKLLDALFGAEEEFQYTPPAAAPPGAA